MTSFQTTPAQRVTAAKIAERMTKAGLSTQFVDAVHRLAFDDQGAFELMELWAEARTRREREQLVADLQEAVDEAVEMPRGIVEKAKVNFDNLDAVATQVMEHKRRLRALVDAHGGISAVARRSGIPQPSLSRMLSSASMPRRTTLYRIARALDVEESEVVGSWVR
ncbi:MULTISPECIES: helix-turn-helix transcriptional regulator [Myxococcaceae]|uniref:helix-turn-helix domain-containing protein n=1 Tax=Myxococcaceae TaxID=31 RepID=UPI00188E5B33|nr:helix-turn-helix transcriptional regulator [Simulacricoccus sp. 17bor-14]